MPLLLRSFAWLCLLFALEATMAAQAPPVDLERKGPKVGEPAPDFSGVDQFGTSQTLKTALKTDGAMLVFFRSADW
jgi:hypothetical protein